MLSDASLPIHKKICVNLRNLRIKNLIPPE
jgi:hypothetical protein